MVQWFVEQDGSLGHEWQLPCHPSVAHLVLPLGAGAPSLHVTSVGPGHVCMHQDPKSYSALEPQNDLILGSGVCGVPGAASGSRGWGRRGEGTWGAGGLACGTLRSSLSIPGHGRYSERPPPLVGLSRLLGASSPTPALFLSLLVPWCLSRAGPSAAAPPSTSSLFLLEDSLQLMEGPSASLVGHSYLPGPTSPAPGNAPPGPLAVAGADVVLGKCSALQ